MLREGGGPPCAPKSSGLAAFTASKSAWRQTPEQIQMAQSSRTSPAAARPSGLVRYPPSGVKQRSHKVPRRPQILRHVTPQRPASPAGAATRPPPLSTEAVCETLLLPKRTASQRMAAVSTIKGSKTPQNSFFWRENAYKNVK